MRGDEFIKKVDIGKIATEGKKIYEKIKDRYEPHMNGKYLAIDIDTGEAFPGKTSAEAMMSAMERYPDKVFYVAKIGFYPAEIMASYLRRS